ncbi:unnamed protein product, partial [Iphiclides podalirius]
MATVEVLVHIEIKNKDNGDAVKSVYRSSARAIPSSVTSSRVDTAFGDRLSVTAREPFDYTAGGGGVTTPPKVASRRGAESRASTRPMPPGPLASLESRKARALTTIYAPRKQKSRKNRTAQNRMPECGLPVKSAAQPFRPLPAIGQKTPPKAKVIVFDLNRGENTIESQALKLQEVLKPLTPLSIHGFKRKDSSECLRSREHRLLRENTYDVIEPIYLNSTKRNDSRYMLKSGDGANDQLTISPKSRFKRAAMRVAKLTSMPETGKLLSMREREKITISFEDNLPCKLQDLPQSPARKINKLSEIFQRLDMNGRHRDQMKKENSWF